MCLNILYYGDNYNSIEFIDFLYGNTIKDAAKDFVAFAKSKGYKLATYKGEERDPSVAWLKDKLEFKRPIFMGYTINVNGYDRSHAVSILGWYKAKKVSSGNTYNYLKVYDAWRDTSYYLNYTTVDFSKYCRASCNEVKKDYIQAGGQPQKGDIIRTQYAKERTKKGETYDILLCEKIELWDIEKERFDKMEGGIRDNEIK